MENSASLKATLIVPCAGFGRRVGSPPAKELLPHPETHKPLIESVLDVAFRNQWPLVLITRPEKSSLIDYTSKRAQELGLSLQWVLARKTREWPESVLLSQRYWSDKNILILPDTDWNPQGIERQLCKRLEDSDVCYGSFNASDPEKWGCFEVAEKTLKVCEKPQRADAHFHAWGMISFRREVGIPLFSALLESTMDHKVKTLPIKGSFIPMESFRDLTRPLTL